MANRTLRFDVTNTAQAVSTAAGDSSAVHTLEVYNPTTNTVSVWSGYTSGITPGTVKATDGFEIPAGSSKAWDLSDSETQAVYLVTTSGNTVTVYVDEVGI